MNYDALNRAVWERPRNVAEYAAAFVAGTAVYGAADPAEAVRRLRGLAERAIVTP